TNTPSALSPTGASPVPTDTPNQEIVRGIALSELRQLPTPTPGEPPIEVPNPPVQVPRVDAATEQNTPAGGWDSALRFGQAVFGESLVSLQAAQDIDRAARHPISR